MKKLLVVLVVIGLALMVAGPALQRMWPLVSVDAKAGKLNLLGGVVQVDRISGSLRFRGRPIQQSEAEYKRFTGSRELAPAAASVVRVAFRNGKLDVGPSASRELRWACNLNQKDEGHIVETPDRLTLDLMGTQVVQCGLAVPAGVAVSVAGKTAEVTVHQPAGALEVKLTTGQVELTPAPALPYRYDLAVGSGHVDRFDSSPAPDALPIVIKLGSGNIRHE